MSNGNSASVATIGQPVEMVGADAQGKAVQGLRIPFVTAKGVGGTIFVPGTTVNQDAIVAAVRERAMALDAVADLKV